MKVRSALNSEGHAHPMQGPECALCLGSEGTGTGGTPGRRRELGFGMGSG